MSGSGSNGEPAKDVVAVIDDPISSLDSDSLFIVASYVRDAAHEVVRGDSNIRQLIVLTHNTQFHHEASYTGKGQSAGSRSYYHLLKGANGYTTVRADGAVNRIRTSYSLLWDTIVEAASTNTDSHLLRVGVFNTVRRIIDGYFKTIGHAKDLTKPTDLGPVESRIISTFLNWANAGSHMIVEDVDQTVGIESTRQFLRFFQRFFVIQGHYAHFDMMVRASSGADLLEPGQLLGTTRSEDSTE